MDLGNWMLPALFAVGAVAGCVDAIAGGGGLLTVPVLLGAGLPAQVALGTNKFQSSCGTALAAWNYARAGLLPWRQLVPGLIVTFLSALSGAWMVTRLDPALLKRVIPGLLLVIAVYTALRPNLGAGPQRARMGLTAFGIVFGVGLGFYDGFFGPGTGSFWMMACVLVMGLDLRAATGHTKAMNLTSNLASLAWFAAAGRVDFLIGLVMAGGQLIGAHLGSRMAIRHGGALIRPVFLAAVIALTLKLLWDAIR